MTLRSSPRKRLHISDSSSLLLSPHSNQSPRKSARTTINSSFSHTPPQTKRMRFTESPIAQQNVETPLNKVLKGFSQSQLIDIIQELINNEPHIETKIRENLSMPDIKVMEEQLTQLKKNIFQSLPTSRLLRNTDSVAYSRAATHLTTFKKTVVDQSQQLNDSENWDALIDYCLIAWKITRETPIWENKTHNSIRRSCFKILSWHCLCALKSGGIALGEQRLYELLNQIESMKNDCDDISSCVRHLHDLLEKIANFESSV